MPVILDPDGYDLWLDPGMKNVSAASKLLKPCDAWLMRAALICCAGWGYRSELFRPSAKDADPDIAILKEDKAEYAKLQ
jgi:hypothetical protein